MKKSIKNDESPKITTVRPRLYFDAAATTPVDPRVFQAMEPFWSIHFGNAGSIHAEGVSAKRALDTARQQVAEILHAHSDEIIFTSGGTESNNLAIFGVVEQARDILDSYRKIHMVTTRIEHASVLEACRVIEKRGGRVSYISVDSRGQLVIPELKKAVTDETTLVSVMLANNEIGTVQPILEVAKVIRKIRRESRAAYPYLHVDAAQAPVFMQVNVALLGVDLLSIDGHKIYGPKGIGLLYKKRDVLLAPQMYGGKQEGGLRSGTAPLPPIIGFAEALVLAEHECERNSRKMIASRSYFITQLQRYVPQAILNGDLYESLPNVVNVSIPGAESDFLVIALDERGIACASRSACHAQEDSSYVVAALEKSGEIAGSSVRFSMLKNVTKKDIDYVVSMLADVVVSVHDADLSARGISTVT